MTVRKAATTGTRWQFIVVFANYATFNAGLFVAQYYNEVSTKSEATPITITPPETRTGIDAEPDETVPETSDYRHLHPWAIQSADQVQEALPQEEGQWEGSLREGLREVLQPKDGAGQGALREDPQSNGVPTDTLRFAVRLRGRRSPFPAILSLSAGAGTRQTPDNVGRRLKSAITKANAQLEAVGIAPISEGASPHSPRRTYASLRYACGDDPVYVAEQGGWTDPSFPMKVYAKAVKRRDRLSGAHREAFDAALQWAAMGSGAENDPSDESAVVDNAVEETATRAENLDFAPVAQLVRAAAF